MLGPLGFGLIILSLCYGPYRFPRSETFYLEVTTTTGVLLGVTFIALQWLITKWKGPRPPSLVGWALPLCIFLVSDIPFRLTGFIQPQNYLFDLACCGALGVIAVLLFPPKIEVTALWAGIILAISGFMSAASGRLLFSDDHPSFLYRLIQLKENFPHIPFYNPLWNGGVDAREFFPSGVLNLYFLGLPFVYVGDIAASYNYLIIFILFVLCPLAVYGSARLFDIEKSGAAAAALLGLGSSLYWYRWALAHGTMGFIISSIMLLPVLALTATLFGRIHYKKIILFSLFLASSLMIFWSLSFLFILPLCLTVLLKWRSLRYPGAVILLGALLFLTHLPWLTLFAKSSHVFQFVTADETANGSTAGAEADPRIRHIAPEVIEASHLSALELLRKTGTTTHPLIVLCALPGLLLIANPVSRIIIGSTLGWLIGIGLFGSPVKPQLELERFLIVAAFLAAIPAGAFTSALIAKFRSGFAAIPATVVLVIFCYTVFWIFRVANNKTVENFYFADNTVSELSRTLHKRSHTGRALFAGFTLHELSHGHVAPLPALSEAPLVASRYQHDRWLYIDVIPKEFRDAKDKGVEAYLDLMNVSTIITHDKFWRAWYQKRGTRYKVIKKTGRFTVFARMNAVNSYFIEGNGMIKEQNGSRLIVSLITPDVVLKFNYFPFLKAPGCIVEPAPMPGGLTFLKLRECPINTAIEISSIPPWERIRE